jgi:SAP domain
VDPIISEDSIKESYCIRLCRPRAELVGYLTNKFTEVSMIWANDFRLEDFARMIMRLTVEELKHAAEEAGLAGIGSKAELVLRLVEHCYSDVLVPVYKSS